jgi:hypothetical protein
MVAAVSGDVVVMARFTARVRGAEAVALLLSVTVTVKVDVWAVAPGVPVKAPAVLSVRPAGREPVVTAHV